MPAGDGSVYLGGRKFNVAEQLLDSAQIGTAFEKMGGKRMPERVRECAEPLLHHPSHPPRVEWSASGTDPESRICLVAREMRPAVAQIALNR